MNVRTVIIILAVVVMAQGTAAWAQDKPAAEPVAAETAAVEKPVVVAEPVAAAQEAVRNEYTVGVEDVLDISVLQPEKLLVTVTVTPDGSISFPYIGNVAVKGQTLTKIQDAIQSRLADGYMKYPVVNVTLRETRSKKYFVYGEVVRPGTYLLDEGATVLKAITMAGGFNKYGSASRVKVMREKKGAPGYETFKVNMKSVMDGASNEDLVLQPGDIVVVSEGVF